MMTRLIVDTPLGPLWLAATDTGLAGAWFEGQRHFPAGAAAWPGAPHPVLDAARRQIAEYFDGRRQRFDLALDLHGTPFQRRVWEALRAIPYGATTTYGELAAGLALPRGARAVGAAVGRNPASVIVPCHRVVGGTGALTGYAGGLDRKAHLLRLEADTPGGRRLRS